MGRRFQEIAERERERGFSAVKEALLTMEPVERYFVLCWLCKYFNDNGDLLSPSVSKERDRVTIAGAEYWLVAVPKRGRRTST